jgi:hypothetical protein
MSDSSGGPRVPVAKGGLLVVGHTASADMGFIPESKLMFRSKLQTLADYRNEVTSETFKNWFEEHLLHISPESLIIMDSASIHSSFAR